jgi:hypothetical protein
MKREITVGMTVTEDEYRFLRQEIREKEDELGKRMTMSVFLRENLLKPYMNGNSSPPQETKIETNPDEPKKEDLPGFDFKDISF